LLTERKQRHLIPCQRRAGHKTSVALMHMYIQ